MSALAIQAAFEALTPQSVPALVALYAADARFKDPFNAVQGRAAIAKIFTHMFTQVQNPRFVVTRVIENTAVSNDLFMRWDFSFVTGGKARCIHGATHFERDAAGLITLHRDYWDAAEELYETLPILGSLMRWLKRKLAVTI